MYIHDSAFAASVPNNQTVHVSTLHLTAKQTSRVYWATHNEAFI